jgi:integrase
MEIKQYECVKRWLRNVTGNSLKLYPRYFGEFCQFVNLTPDQLLAKAVDDKGLEDVHDLAKQFYEKLEREGLAPWTCTIGYSAVRSFMKWNSKRLGPMPKKFKGHVAYESDRILQPGEVAKMVDMAPSLRDKAVIKFLHESAQRAGILTALRYGDIRKQLEAGTTPIVVDIKAVLFNVKRENVNKKRVRYKFAVGKETADYLARMVKERGQLNDNSWLFATSNETWLDLDAIMTIVKHAAEKAGIQVIKDLGTDRHGRPRRKFEIHSHVFRRSWKHAMRQAGVTDADFLNFVQGHELPYEGAYDRYSTEDVRKEYLKAEPYMTVMFNPEVAKKVEYDREYDAYLAATGKKPEDVLKDWGDMPFDQRHSFLKMRRAQETSKSDEKKVMVIDEREAENHLNHGYEFVTVLPSGKLLVRLKEV